VGGVSNMRLPCPKQKIQLVTVSEKSKLKMNCSKISKISKISQIRNNLNTFSSVIRTRVANVITLLIEIWGKFLRASPDLISAPHFWRTIKDL